MTPFTSICPSAQATDPEIYGWGFNLGKVEGTVINMYNLYQLLKTLPAAIKNMNTIMEFMADVLCGGNFPGGMMLGGGGGSGGGRSGRRRPGACCGSDNLGNRRRWTFRFLWSHAGILNRHATRRSDADTLDPAPR